LYSLTLQITFQFKFFHYHLADPSITLNYDPRNINTTQVEQTFITLQNRPASRRKSVVDSQVKGWAKWVTMNKTLCVDAKKTLAIRDMFSDTTRYKKQKSATIQRLFLILAAHPEAMVRCLADLVPHPETQESVFWFVVFCTGRKMESKKRVVNSVMTIFAVNLIMINNNNDTALDLDTLSEKEIADLQYVPSTHGLCYKHIFSWMNNESISFAQKDFKGMRGKSIFRIFCKLVLSVSNPILLTLPTYRFLPCRYQGQVRKNVESASGLRKTQICSGRSSSSSESATCLQGRNSQSFWDDHDKQWF